MKPSTPSLWNPLHLLTMKPSTPSLWNPIYTPPHYETLYSLTMKPSTPPHFETPYIHPLTMKPSTPPHYVHPHFETPYTPTHFALPVAWSWSAGTPCLFPALFSHSQSSFSLPLADIPAQVSSEGEHNYYAVKLVYWWGQPLSLYTETTRNISFTYWE